MADAAIKRIHTPSVRWNIKQKVKQLIKQRVQPTLQLVNNFPHVDEILSMDINQPDVGGRFLLYNCDLKKYPLQIEDAVDDFYLDTLTCIQSYPEKYIYLVGYTYNDHTKEQYISDMYLLNNPDPNGSTIFD